MNKSTKKEKTKNKKTFEWCLFSIAVMVGTFLLISSLFYLISGDEESSYGVFCYAIYTFMQAYFVYLSNLKPEDD